MSWKPVSKLDYENLNPKGQILVIMCPLADAMQPVFDRWRDRACAVIHDSKQLLRDVVRDLLANPQVRAIVFDGNVCSRETYDAFWLSSDVPDWRIDKEHLTLVRQFVDLYDDDCNVKSPMQPFWPARILYTEES